MYSQIKEGFLNLETVPKAKTLTNRHTFHKRLTLIILHARSCLALAPPKAHERARRLTTSETPSHELCADALTVAQLRQTPGALTVPRSLTVAAAPDTLSSPKALCLPRPCFAMTSLHNLKLRASNPLGPSRGFTNTTLCLSLSPLTNLSNHRRSRRQRSPHHAPRQISLNFNGSLPTPLLPSLDLRPTLQEAIRILGRECFCRRVLL